jgi:GTP-binding protein Era
VDVAVLVTRCFDLGGGKGDEFVSRLMGDATVPVILVLNKIDLVSKPRLLPLIDQLRRWHDFADIVPLSAATGDGVDRLGAVAARADAGRGGAVSGRTS